MTERNTPAVKTFTLPGTSIVAPNVVLGLMRIAEKSDDDVRALMRAARDAGIDFVDHADIYGPPPHGCEARFADAMALTPSQRDALTIQTKCGIAPGRFDFSYEHIISSVEGSVDSGGHRNRRSPISSIGFLNASRLRGRSLSSWATHSRSSLLCTPRSVPLGKYCRSRPLVFSFVPRCQGECGSQK